LFREYDSIIDRLIGISRILPTGSHGYRHPSGIEGLAGTGAASEHKERNTATKSPNPGRK
jgi:hypothetical protein